MPKASKKSAWEEVQEAQVSTQPDTNESSQERASKLRSRI